MTVAPFFKAGMQASGERSNSKNNTLAVQFNVFPASFFRNYFCFFVGIVFFLFLGSSCSLSSLSVYVRNGSDQLMVGKVAVLPFYNKTNTVRASTVVTGAFVESLVQRGKFRVEFPGNIRNFLISNRIIVRTGVDVNTIKLMGKRLGVDAVIIGRVDEFVGMEEKKKNVIPVVSISARMVDAQTGKILWMAEHRRNGDDYIKVLDFGKIRSVGALTKKVADEMIQTMP
jgi:TolB-like protein